MLNDELLHKWMNGTISKDELEEFKLRPEFDSLQELKQHTDTFVAPDFDEEKMLAHILAQKKNIVTPTNTGRRFFLSNWARVGVAAAILLLVGWFFYPTEKMMTYAIGQGQKVNATLPDGSTFTLNAESKLTYSRKKWENKRTLNLEGEAFFEVKKGSTFKVITPNGDVQVLGTKFNVRSRKNSFDVQCQSGKVDVISTKGKILQELTPGDVVRIIDNKIVDTWTINVAKKPSWIDGVFRFKKVP